MKKISKSTIKKIIVIIIGVLAIVAVALCVRKVERVEHGVVTEVRYHEPYTTYSLVPVRCGNVTVMRTQPINHPAKWVADICYEDSIYDSSVFYHKVEVGDSATRTVVVKYTTIFEQED